MLIKTSGIDPLRCYDIFEILSLAVQNYNERSRPGLIISGDRSKGPDKNLFRTKTNLVPRIYPAGFYNKKEVVWVVFQL